MRKIVSAKAQIQENSKESRSKHIPFEDIQRLPLPVRNWLIKSGVMEMGVIQTVTLTQEAEMLLKPDQKKWMPAKAEQFISVEQPGFTWSVFMKMNPFVWLSGRDKFEKGRGEMCIKLFSFIPVVNIRHNKKIDQATLQRYLAEMVWFPSAVLNPCIEWREIDSYTAEATMDYKGTKGSGIFYFNENGCFREFCAMRWRDIEDKELTKWLVTATRTEARNGVMIPTELEASWKLGGDTYWKWLKLKVRDIQFT